MVLSKKRGKYLAVFNAVLCVCADPGIFTKWGGGGGGVEGIVQAHLTVKSLDSVVLLFLLFFSPHL